MKSSYHLSISCLGPGGEDRGQFAGSEVVVRRPVNIVTLYLDILTVLYLDIYTTKYYI